VEQRCPLVEFDHNSPDHGADTVGSYRRLRETAPVAWSNSHGGYWILSDYETVFEAARTESIFSSARSSAGGEGLNNVIPKAQVHLHIPVELDPPEQRMYRKIINPITAPAAIASLAEMIARHTSEFIDEIIELGECDLASLIGIPAAITIDWLGLPAKDWRRYSAAHHAIVASPFGSPEQMHARNVEFPWMNAQINEAINDRRANPTDDAISYLVHQEIEGQQIGHDEVFSIIELLISGGVGTTASLVSQTLVHLQRDRETRADLIAHPEKMERAVEEFLRAFSPAQALARTVLRDTEVRGCPMSAGDRVLLSWSAANRDPAVFENPDEIDIDRWPNRHASFGIGVHRCAGSHLARAMSREILNQILERMPDYEIDETGLERYDNQGTNAGFKRIPARFTPGLPRF
jgi:cytochrome P450